MKITHLLRRKHSFDATQSDESYTVAINEAESQLLITMRKSSSSSGDVSSSSFTDNVSYGANEPESGSAFIRLSDLHFQLFCRDGGTTTRTSLTSIALNSISVIEKKYDNNENTSPERLTEKYSDVIVDSQSYNGIAPSWMELIDCDDVYDVEPTFDQIAVRTSFATDYIHHHRDYSPLRTPNIPKISESHQDDTISNSASSPPFRRDVSPLPKETEYATMAAAAFYAAMQTHPLPLINFKDEHPLLYHRDAYVARRNQAKYMRSHRRSIQEQAGLKKPSSRLGSFVTLIGDSIKTLRAKNAHEKESKKLSDLHRRLSIVEQPSASTQHTDKTRSILKKKS